MLQFEDELKDIYGEGEGFEKQLDQKKLEQFQKDLVQMNADRKVKPAIQVNGDIALSQQMPWIRSQTIRDNILYGSKLDKQRYLQTIRDCQLERDFSILEAGDLTEIGEKGINLSGGQKARVSLARAVYQEKDIFLMDDPISALDAHVRKNIIRKVIMGNLKDKTRVLVTHAIDFLELADRVVVLDKGEIKANGHFNDIKQHPIIVKLLEINEINTEHTTQNCT